MFSTASDLHLSGKSALVTAEARALHGLIKVGGGGICEGLHFGSKKKTELSINPRKLSIFYWYFSNRSEALFLVGWVFRVHENGKCVVHIISDLRLCELLQDIYC